MLFNSPYYFIFLPLIFLLFFFSGSGYRWMILLLASYAFYGFLFKPILLAVLTVVILLTYWIGKFIDRSQDLSARRMFLWIGVIINLALLIYFKYLPFLTQNLNLFMKSFGINFIFKVPALMVSVGLSFFIFQAISYLADIYFRVIRHEPHFGYFALYLAFFPKLLQGPIERAGYLLPQLKIKYEFNYENMRLGMLLFTWGLLKKVVIADRLGPYVDVVYNDVHSFTGLPLLLSTYAYAFQIYMDFSGYTDMALGSARFFNIELNQNFNRPYIATSIADFWRRWHISFSSWIRDYIFEPLEMQWRNWEKWGTAAALLVTFLAAGIWHGASWGFAVFGLLHGLYLVCSFFYKPYQKKMHKALGIEKTWFLKAWQVFVTFNLLCFAWVFFRANSLGDAFYVLANMFSGIKGMRSGFLLSQGNTQLLLTMISILVYAFITAYFLGDKSISEVSRKKLIRPYIFYNLLIYTIFFLAKYGLTKSFIYFQF